MDKKLAQSYIGKHLLFGLTYLDHNEEVVEQTQLHGKILRITEDEGIVIKLHNTDEEFTLPPALESLSVAEPGEYRLRSTGDVVKNPDLIASWKIFAPPQNDR